MRAAMSIEINGARLTSLFRPRSVALVGASLEVNPLGVDGATVEALDAVVTWISPDDRRS
jgi:hypothetical protein